MYVLLRLLKLILLGAIVYIIYKLLWKGESFFKSKKSSRHQQHPQKAIEEMKKDPVCGTYIPENQAVLYQSGSQTYFFCSEECKQKFRNSEETKKSAQDG